MVLDVGLAVSELRSRGKSGAGTRTIPVIYLTLCNTSLAQVCLRSESSDETITA